MRLIDVSALKEWVENWFTKNRLYHPYAKNNNIPITELYDILEQIPNVEPEPKWIPCVDGNEPKANADCWISTNAKFVRRASYAPKANNQPNGFIVTVGSFGFYEYGKSAKAWMPYTKDPEPYREEGGERCQQ